MTSPYALVAPGTTAGRTRRSARWLVVVLALGMAATGGRNLSAQDVPPPPPDDQSSQPQQYPPQQQGDQQPLPQYGAPADGSQQAPAPYDQGQQPYGQQQGYPAQDQPYGQAPVQQGQPLGPDQLNQLVAPIALYPDALVAQILAAATYPTQISQADQWVQSQGNVPADQLANMANSQPWDPSVKALVAFPSVLSQMDRNMQWTTDLGNAYYNQPQDVMDAIQQMRQRAQSAGTLESNQQQVVTDDGGDIAIAPANPDIVYVPYYNPWSVYGPAVVAFPGYYYAPPPGLFIGIGIGWGLRFGIGVPIRPWAPWGWGWHHWGVGWHNRTVVYNRTTYITRSTTVINRGFNRPGAPPRELAGARGSFMNHPGYAGYANHVSQGARPAQFGNNNRPVYNNGWNNGTRQVYRPSQPGNGAFNGGQQYNHQQPAAPRPSYSPGQNYNYNNRTNNGVTQYRPSAPQQNYNRQEPAFNRPAQNYNRPVQQPGFNRPMETHSAPVQHAAPQPHFSAPHVSGGGGGGHHR